MRNAIKSKDDYDQGYYHGSKDTINFCLVVLSTVVMFVFGLSLLFVG